MKAFVPRFCNNATSRVASCTLRAYVSPCLLLLFLATPALANEKITFDDHITPILRTHCLSCHNPDRARGGLDLSTYMGAMNGGSGGAIIEPGDPGGSKLYAVITHAQEPTMPPNRDKLPQAELDVFRKWLEAGALENKGSKAPKLKKKLDLSLAGAPTGKPEGPAAMPNDVRLEPFVRTERTNAVTTLAASPWAPLVAIGGQKQILLYNLDTQQLVGVLPFDDAFPETIRFSRSGNVLMVGGGRGAKEGFVNLYDVTTGQRLTRLGEEYDTVLAADVAADQSRVALGGPGKVVRIHATADGERLHTITKHTEWITAITFSPDAVLLATADRNGGLHVWEAATGNLFHTLEGHEQAITSLDFRPDSNILASASEDGQVRLWSMHDGKRVRNWNAHGGGTLSVRYTHDGRLVTTGRDNHVKIWNGEGQQQRAIRASDDLTLTAAFDHEGKRVIVGDWLGNVRIFSAEDGKPLGTLDSNPPSLTDRIAAAQKRLDEVKAAHDKHAAEHAAVAKQVDEAKQAFAAAQKQIGEIAQTVAELNKQITAIREKALALAKAEIEAGNELNARRAERDQAVKAMQAAEAARRDHVARHEEATAALAARTEEAEQAAQAAVVAKEKADATPEDAALAQAAAEAQSAADAAQQAVTAASAAVEQHAAQLAQATDALNAASAALNQAEQQVKAVEAKLAEQSAAHQTATAEHKAMTERMAAAIKEQEAALAKVKALDEKVKSLTTTAEEKQAALKEAAAQRAAAEREHAHWTAAHFNLQVIAARDEVTAREAAFEEHQAAAATVESERDALRAERDKLTRQLTAGPTRLTLVNHLVYRSYFAAHEAEDQVDAALTHAADCQALVRQAESLHAVIVARAAASPDNAALADAVTKSAATLEALKADLAAAQERIATREAAVQAALKAVLAARNDVAQAQTDLAALPDRITALEPKLAELEKALAPLATARDEAKQALTAAQARLDALTEQYQSLKLAAQ